MDQVDQELYGERRIWQKDLCQWHEDITLTLITCFLPCLVSGKIGERILLQDKFLGCCCFCLCPQLVTCLLRNGVRNYLKIDGNMLQDCCFSFCCTCCTLIQMSSEAHLTPGCFFE